MACQLFSAKPLSDRSLSSLAQVMACHLLDPKPFPEPMLTYYQLELKKTSLKFESKYETVL